MKIVDDVILDAAGNRHGIRLSQCGDRPQRILWDGEPEPVEYPTWRYAERRITVRLGPGWKCEKRLSEE